MSCRSTSAVHMTAQEEIRAAIAVLEEGDRLPEAITARAQAISELAGTSLGTLYRHKGLWHPQHQESEERCVIAEAAVDTAPVQPLLPSPTKQLDSLRGEKLQTKQKDNEV